MIPIVSTRFHKVQALRLHCFTAVLILGYALVFAGHAHAQRDLHNIAMHPKWLALLHFDRGGAIGTRRSAIIDDSFFLAPNGSEDPKAELLATLSALTAPQTEEYGLHAQCQFPARAKFLAEFAGFVQNSLITCPDWETWRSERSEAEIGLIFASGYLGNPASFFGHMMLHLKMAPQASIGESIEMLLDPSINFGADVPDSDGLVTYMLRGLFGGYRAEFSNTPFFRNTAVYSESEMRELWYYPLNLTTQERDLLVAHLWEIFSVQYDYLFLTQNCASRIGRTLELVIDAQITPRKSLWVSPESIIRSLSKLQSSEGGPLMGPGLHRPSRRLLTEHMFSALSPKQQQAAAAAWPSLNQLDLSHPYLLTLSDLQQAQIIDTWLSHVSFLNRTNPDIDIGDVERRMLAARLQLPINYDIVAFEPPQPIDKARPTARLAVGGGAYSGHATGARLTFRPIQYDLLDSDHSRQPDASLELLKADLRYVGGRLRLKSLTAFNVSNLHSETVRLPGLNSMAWRVTGGWETYRVACPECRAGFLATVEAGRSVRKGRSLAYALGGIRLNTKQYESNQAALTIEAGWMIDNGTNSRTILRLNHHNAFTGADSRSTRVGLDFRQAVSANRDIRVSVLTDLDNRDSEALLMIGYYF